MRWKYDQVHTTLQRRKGLKTVSSLCTTEVQVVRWCMDQLWCHMSHTSPRRERVRSSPSDKHSQRLSKALLTVGGHVFVSCDTSLSDPLCKSIPCECPWLQHNCTNLRARSILHGESKTVDHEFTVTSGIDRDTIHELLVPPFPPWLISRDPQVIH